MGVSMPISFTPFVEAERRVWVVVSGPVSRIIYSVVYSKSSSSTGCWVARCVSISSEMIFERFSIYEVEKKKKSCTSAQENHAG